MSIVCGAAAVGVAAIYYVWRAHAQVTARREQLLRRRVAYMLWVMAEEEAVARAAPRPCPDGRPASRLH
jgi:hypothetical protein